MLKQLNRLTLINKFSCLAGREVTPQIAVTEFPGSIQGSGKDLCLLFLFCFYFLSKNIIYNFT